MPVQVIVHTSGIKTHGLVNTRFEPLYCNVTSTNRKVMRGHLLENSDFYNSIQTDSHTSYLCVL